MSGGSMDYVYIRIEEAAELTEDETITQLLMDLANVLHDEEWADCGDISDADYQDTLLKFKRKWFNQEPKVDVDCISRAEAMTEIQLNAKRYSLAKECGGMGQEEWSDYLISIKDALDILIKLSSVKQEQKVGHWINETNCGAKMGDNENG